MTLTAPLRIMPRMFLLYEVLLHLVFILLLPFFLIVGFLRGKYLANFPERLGHYRHPKGKHDVWFHAVSVGEVMAAKTIIAALQKRRPELSFVVTTTTITGQQTAKRLLPGVTVTYFPFDFSRSVKRFLDHHQPRLLVLVETEIWPNVSRISGERGLEILLVNGRISDRSFGKYRSMRWIIRPILRLYRAVLVREQVDRERFIAIGAPESRVEVAGNVKFDYTPDATPLDYAEHLEYAISGRKVCAFGSTVEDEDAQIGPIIERLVTEGNFVIFAPRKPERFEFAAGMLAASQLRFARRSEWEKRPASYDVLLVDTIGELARLYRYATAAFVGGSLIPGTGGHNPIEPAAVGCPVAFGPYVSNFREISNVFLDHDAAVQVRDVNELIDFFEEMTRDEEAHARLAQRAEAAVRQNQGAADRIAAVVMDALP